MPTTVPVLRRASACLLLLLGACGSTDFSDADIPSSVAVDKVPLAIAEAERALDADRPDEALDWLYATHDAEGIPFEERDRIRELTAEAAGRLVAGRSLDEKNAESLAKLVDAELPRQISVTSGIDAATLLVKQGKDEKAFEVIRRLDKKYPTHHERARAAALLVELGLRLSYSNVQFWFFYNERKEGREALEHVTQNYPGRPRGDEAYARLAEMYEEDREWGKAIDRHHELMLMHPASPLAVTSEARVPYLRLQSIVSPEYDRGALTLARSEFETWLQTHAGHPLTPEVERDLIDCFRRLSESDLLIAAFYDRVDAPEGVRRHAARALEEARKAGDTGRIDRARDFLESAAPEREPAE